jgi:hypothetical protein
MPFLVCSYTSREDAKGRKEKLTQRRDGAT